jgi:hypothetical protein
LLPIVETKVIVEACHPSVGLDGHTVGLHSFLEEGEGGYEVRVGRERRERRERKERRERREEEGEEGEEGGRGTRVV